MTRNPSTPHHPQTIAQMLESDGPGGAEVLLAQLSSELRDRGHSIVPVGPLDGHGWLAGKLIDDGFDPETFSLRRAVDPGCIYRMVRMLRRRGVTAIHSHEFVMSVYGAACAEIMRIPHVMTMHGSQQMTESRRNRIALRWAFRQRSTRAVVAVSGETRDHLITTLGLPPGRIEVVLNGVPVRPGDRARGRVELGARADEPVLLGVGSLRERKGFRVLLTALATIQRERPELPWRVAIAGQGEDYDRLMQMIHELDLTDRARLLGMREDIPDLQAGADIFVMPSLWEGLPLAMLEGMLAGNAVVASRCSGIPEALTDEVDGLLTTPGDTVTLTEALIRVIESPDLREALGKSGQARALSNFTISRMADDYLQLYFR